MSKLARNTAGLAINRFCPPVFGFILLVFVGLQSSELLGWYTIVTVYFFALQTLPFLGLTPLIVKEAARRPDEAGEIFATTVVVATGIAGLLCAVLPVVLAHHDQPADVDTAIWICAATTFPYIVAYSAELILVSFHEPRLLSVVPLAENTIRVALSLIALKLGYGLAALFCFTLGGRVIAAIAYTVELRRRVLVEQPIRFSRRIAQEWFTQCPVFLVHALTFLVASRAAFIALDWITDEVAVAHFSVGYRILDLGTIGLTAFAGAVYPSLSKAATSNRDQFAFISLKSTKLALSCALGFAFAGLLGADAFVATLFPKQYPEAVPVMRWMVLCLIFTGARVAVSGVLFASDRPQLDLWALVVGAVVYIGLLAWLVPLCGILGAAIATLVEGVFQVGVRIWFVRDCFHASALTHERIPRLALLALVGLGSAYGVLVGLESNLARAVVGVVLSGTFGIALLRVGILGEDDFRFLGLDRLWTALRPLHPQQRG